MILMKIDNKGWGLNTMLIMVCVIIVFLLLATYFAIRLNSIMGNKNNESENQVQKMVNQSYYINKVNDMTEAAEKFINDNEIKISDVKFKVGMATLVNYNYMDYITDSITNNKCTGYSIAYYDANNIKIIRSYIKCDNYESKGYGDN